MVSGSTLKLIDYGTLSKVASVLWRGDFHPSTGEGVHSKAFSGAILRRKLGQ